MLTIKTAGKIFLLILLLLPFGFTTSLVHAKENEVSDVLKIIEDKLASIENRMKAMDQLVATSDEEAEAALLRFILDPQEQVTLRNRAASVLIKLNRKSLNPKLEEIIFKKAASDSLSKDLALSILVNTIERDNKSILAGKIVEIIKNESEKPAVRKHLFDQLFPLSEFLENQEWAVDIAKSASKDKGIRVAALSHLERVKFSNFSDFLPLIIKDDSDNPYVRQNAILLADRINLPSLAEDLKAIVLNKEEKMEMKQFSLQILGKRLNSENLEYLEKSLKESEELREEKMPLNSELMMAPSSS